VRKVAKIIQDAKRKRLKLLLHVLQCKFIRRITHKG